MSAPVVDLEIAEPAPKNTLSRLEERRAACVKAAAGGGGGSGGAERQAPVTGRRVLIRARGVGVLGGGRPGERGGL